MELELKVVELGLKVVELGLKVVVRGLEVVHLVLIYETMVLNLASLELKTAEVALKVVDLVLKVVQQGREVAEPKVPEVKEAERLAAQLGCHVTVTRQVEAVT